MSDIISDIAKNIKWLELNAKTDNVLTLTNKVNELQVQSATLMGKVVEAYKIMNEAEDDYKLSVASYVANSERSAAAAERMAESEFGEKKRFWTSAKTTYKKLDMILDRIDKICDSQRQKISVIKQAEMKNLQ
jgi:hypothetical protein